MNVLAYVTSERRTHYVATLYHHNLSWTHLLTFNVFQHYILCVYFFFFQAEDGIRDYKVTGVQTCALPIWQFDIATGGGIGCASAVQHGVAEAIQGNRIMRNGRCIWVDGIVEVCVKQIGRASCRERV